MITTMRNLSVLLLGLQLVNPSLAGEAELRRSWTLYHSMDPKLGDAGLSKRGVLTMDAGGEGGVQLTLENDDLSVEQVNAMMTSGWYQLQLVGDDGGDAVKTTVPACQLRLSNFRDEIILSFGQRGHVLSVAYSPLVSPLAPKTCDDLPTPSADKLKFTSKVEYETAVPGMSLKTVLGNYQPPPGLHFIPSSKSGSRGAGGGEAKPDGFFDPKGDKKEEVDASIFGFFKRYWYIIVPMLLMQMMAAPEPEQQQEGGGGQQQSGGQTAARGGGGGGGGGSSSKHRRGKRG